MAEAGRLNERLVHRALSLDGTCTGEHGIGCGKMDFLVAEHGEAVNVMRAIKQAIDTDNIMNPGKILRIYAPAVWTSPDAQHPLIFDILSGRGGLNHGWVTKDVGWRSLAERFGLNLLTQECYRVLAGGTPSSIAPLG